MCLFIFPVRKFSQSEVQEPMGSLTRPVTADHTHHYSGHDEHADDDDDRGLDHSSVPLILPSTMLIAMAEMNIAVMMYNKSM